MLDIEVDNEVTSWIPKLNSLINLYKDAKKPLVSAFEVTSGCNLNCPHCYLGSRRSEANFASSERWIKIAKILKKIGVVMVEITGGEPLLYPDLKKLVKFLSKYFITGILTNLTLVSNKNIKTLLACTFIRGSIYGLGESYYTGGEDVDADEKILKSVKRLLASGANISVAYQATKCNIHMYPKAKREFERIGLKLSVNYHFANTVYNREAKTYMPSPEDVVRYINPALKYREGKARRCHIQISVNIRSDLTVTPCLLFPHHDSVRFVEDEIVKYYLREAYKFYEIGRLDSPCDKCPYEACRVKHCYAHNIAQSGSPYYRDPYYCNYYSRLYKLSSNITYR